MDGLRFDQLTTQLARGHSRRSIVLGVIGGLSAVAGRGVAQAGPRCRDVGQSCGRGQRCCEGYICVVDRRGKGLCAACPRGQIECAGSCISACVATDDCHVAGECNPETGACTNPAAPFGTVCAGAPDACHDPSTCDENGVCQPGGEIGCPAGDACSFVYCDLIAGCVFEPINCDDGDMCTYDSCDPATGCIHEPINCEDGDPCTFDYCDPTTGCHNEPIC